VDGKGEFMAANIFLKFEPEVKGESKQKGYENQLEILSMSWGVTQAGGFAYSDGGGVAKSNLHDLSLSFRHCSASPKLMQYCASGKHLDKVTVTCLKAGGDAAQKYQVIVLEDVVISSYQTGTSGDEMPIESVSVNFAKVEQEYFAQDDKGITKSAGKGQWDQRKATTK
jgi:type VI secretion system secreted protein Hcp